MEKAEVIKEKSVYNIEVKKTIKTLDRVKGQDPHNLIFK